LGFIYYKMHMLLISTLEYKQLKGEVRHDEKPHS